MTTRRVIAVALAALLACAIVCSLAFICAEAHHDCDGDDCPVCARLALCRDAIGRLARIAAALTVAAAALVFLPRLAATATVAFAATPVSAGVKMLN